MDAITEGSMEASLCQRRDARQRRQKLDRARRATWSNGLAKFGLRLNVKKTEYLANDSSMPGPININETERTWATTFKYLESQQLRLMAP
ncbi:hypothetical protein V3C99_002226 [Haemonchus contortus]|uniref:Reverse transcriptase domain-containing protein n=1 Tax=Haemonchus contortus TaxID=6289 RepID=A0A7I4YAJ8_HAECO